MNSMPNFLQRRVSGTCSGAGHRALLAHALASVACLAAAALFAPVQAATALADQPLFATKSVPGNLALALSVEFPTAVSAAYVNRVYSVPYEYLGYFDPKKCYVYHVDPSGDTTTVNNYFTPSSITGNHVCNTSATDEWSGNFLNFASMQTIDPFRWVLTGGYRVVDGVTRTVVEKGWGSSTFGSNAQNFPDGNLSGTVIAGATPFGAYTKMNTSIWGLGNKMNFSLGTGSFPMKGEYFNNVTLTGAPAVTRIDNDTSFIAGGVQPAPGIGPDNYSVRWTGKIKAPATGTYNFQTNSDDGVRLYINGTLVIDNFTNHAPVVNTGTTASITAGNDIDVVLEFFQGAGGAIIDLKWQPPGATSYSAIGGGTPLADLSATATHFINSNAAAGTAFEVFVRARTCDPSVGLEANCVKYGSHYKPEGLLQFYSNKIRYSAFGYLNDNDIRRDGGVLRAQQKFVGPTQPVPNSSPIVNAAAEWSATTGIFTLNPDAADAANTAAIMGLPAGADITNSGVLNYLNKFGEIDKSASASYKIFDPVSELYYGVLRYFRNIAPVPEWTAVGSASDAEKIKWTDYFPVITSPADPILYSCQRNFILGVGDTNLNPDKNVPGNTTTMRANEPPLPSSVASDLPLLGVVGAVDAVDATNKVGVLEGIGGGSLGTVTPYSPCCNDNAALIAGLAYSAHVNDIRGRPFGPGLALSEPQTVDTYWVDVQEFLKYDSRNPYYLATKYGGFTKPVGYSYSNTTPLLDSQWHTTTDTFSDQYGNTDKRPDNYFSGGQPDLMKAGLEAAFAKIAAAIGAFTTSFSTALPQLAGTDNASYSGSYDPKAWTGEMIASRLSFDTTATSTTLVEEWKFTDRLATQLAAANGWDVDRFVVTWAGTVGSGVAFRDSGSSKVSSGDLAYLDPTYVSGNDSSDYLNYLRGDQSNEVGGTGKKVYRARDKLLGDIVGSKLTPNGPPSFPFSDTWNPGYSAFKTTWAARRTVIYFGANDGMMHAVNGAFSPTSAGVEKDANYGLEMFAYVPRALFQGPTAANTDGLAALGKPGFTHHYMVNATPLVADIDFSRVPSSTNAKQSPAAGTYDWHSVLIGGLGKGGKAYYAIDVTNPVSMASYTVGATETNTASKVLWEFSDADLGFSYGDPLVMKTKKYGWVVVFTSGYNNSDGKGYFLFVNPQTGVLLEKVTTNTGSTSNDAGLAHAEAFIVDATDGTADAIYAGDLLGNLWRLDVTSTTGTYGDPGKLVKLAKLTDASAGAQPVTTRPSIEVSPSSKKRYVMVGTGRLLDTSDIASTQGQTFYAFTDGTNAVFNATPFAPALTPTYPIVRSQLTVNTTPATPIIFDPAPNAGWLEELGFDRGTPATTTPPAAAIPSTGIAYRIVTDLKSASGSVAFAATLPSGSVCTPSGTSDIYARDFATAQSTLDLRVSYISLTSLATDLSYVSVGGKLRLVAGTDKGGSPQVIPIVNGTGSSLRRLNWRELQVVD